MASRSGVPGASSSSWPTNSSNVRGRIRSASGAAPGGAAAVDGVIREEGIHDRRSSVARSSRWRLRLVDEQGGGDGGVQRLDRRPHRDRSRAGRPRRDARRARPWPSPPISSASGPGEVEVEQRRAARAAPRRRRGSRAASRHRWPSAASRRTAIGSRSALPIEPRSAFQPNGSADARCDDRTVAPAASATRTIAPTLPGSWTSHGHDDQRVAVTVDARAHRPRRARRARRWRWASAPGLMAAITDADALAIATSRAVKPRDERCRRPGRSRASAATATSLKLYVGVERVGDQVAPSSRSRRRPRRARPRGSARPAGSGGW